jgi:hypothetical protein
MANFSRKKQNLLLSLNGTNQSFEENNTSKNDTAFTGSNSQPVQRNPNNTASAPTAISSITNNYSHNLGFNNKVFSKNEELDAKTEKKEELVEQVIPKANTFSLASKINENNAKVSGFFNYFSRPNETLKKNIQIQKETRK